MRSDPLYYINPSAINIIPNANNSPNDLVVYVQTNTKIKVFCPAIPDLDYKNDAFRWWPLAGRNRRLNGGNGKYAIYVRIRRHETYLYTAYIIFSPYVLYDGEWLESHSHLTRDGLSEAYYMGGKNIEPDTDSWYVKIGEVSAVVNNKRTVTLDTGTLGTDAWNTLWEVDDVIYSQFGTLDIAEEGEEEESPTVSVLTAADTVIEVDGENYDREYELDGRKERPSSFYNRVSPEEGRFQPNMLLDRKTGEFMAAQGKFHVHKNGYIEIHADKMELTANTDGAMPSFKLNSANKDRSLVFESFLPQGTTQDYVEWFGFAAPVTVDAGGTLTTGDILSLGVRRRADNTGFARLVLRNIETNGITPVAESATMVDNDSMSFFRGSQGWTPQTLQDTDAKLRIGIDENGYPYIFSSIGSGGHGGLPTEADFDNLPSGGLYVDANGFLKVK